VPQTTDRGLGPLRTILAASHEPWAGAWAELDERMTRSLIEPLRRGLAEHREAMAAAGLDGEAPDEWSVRADRLLEYRRAVGAALLEPLLSRFEESGPAERVGQCFAEALERANARTRELPVEARAPWPEGALAPHPTDSVGRQIGKFFARSLSAARKAGQERSLPLRGVALLHLGQDVAPAQDEAIVAAMSAWSVWAGRLEHAWMEWADAALPALIEADLPESEQTPETWTTVREAATQLQSQLETLAEATPHEETGAAARKILGACQGTLEADLAVAGSFLLPEGKAVAATLEHTQRVTPAHRAWSAEVAARMRLYVSILAILAGASAVQRRVVQRCREGTLSRAGDLVTAASRLRGMVGTLQGYESEAALRDRVSALHPRVAAALQPAIGAIPEPSHVAESLTEVAGAAVDALLSVIRQAPASLRVHDAFAEPPKGASKVEARALPLQELARQSFDALRIERIRSSTDGLLTAIGGVRGDIEGLWEVYAFSRDEALRELGSEEPDSEERAVELMGGALERMASSLETRLQDLDKAVQGAQGRLAGEISEGSSALLGRVGAGRMQAQLLAARSRVADLTAWVADRWGPPARRALAAARSLGDRVVAWIREAVQRTRALLGREGAREVTSARTVQSLADAQALVDRLPLVYQRLFTLEPISDPALLAGRASELEVAMERWRRWHAHEGAPLVVRGRQWSGITSFLNVLAGEIRAEGHSHLSVTLRERFVGGAALADTLSRELGLPACDSLDELAHAVFAADESALPAAVTVDNLEHVFMRAPGGTDLAERLLTLMAETEPRIFWIGGVSTSAWQLIATAEPDAVSQVDVLELPPLGAQAVREAVLARHRRSGLDVHYEESVTTGARLRRRLRRMRSGKGFKRLLEDEFFELLHRASGGYLGLALFQWLQAATFDPDEGVVMRLPTRPDFSVLEQLSLTQNFTLKAFLEHRTLTLEEHDRIFRIPRQESYQVLESLRNRQLIEKVARGVEPGADESDIQIDLRYRVRPLLTGAVIAHLQGRNIVH
jgi:hypothetical protein